VSITLKGSEGILVLDKQYRATEGDLATCRVAQRFCKHSKNPWMDFSSLPINTEPRREGFWQ